MAEYISHLGIEATCGYCQQPMVLRYRSQWHAHKAGRPVFHDRRCANRYKGAALKAQEKPLSLRARREQKRAARAAWMYRQGLTYTEIARALRLGAWQDTNDRAVSTIGRRYVNDGVRIMQKG